MDFKEIDPKGLSQERFRAEVAKGINAIHVCVHTGQKEADAKREALAADVAHIKGSVETLTDLFSSKTPAVKAAMGWKEHAKLLGTIFGSVGGLVLAYQLLWPAILALHAAILGAAP